MRPCFLASAATLLIAAAVAAQTYSFHSVTTSPGPFPLALNLEGWSSNGGIATVVPFQPLGAPVSGFPTASDQWAIVSAGTTGNLSTPSGGPAPATPGTTGNLRVPLPIPNGPAGLAITFDWNYVCLECQNDGFYNDFLQVSLKDSNGAVLQVLLYRDTFSGTYDTAPATSPNQSATVPAGWCVPTLEEAPVGTPKSAFVLVDPLLYGNAGVFFEIDVGNGGDTGFPSYAYIDNVDYGLAGPSVPTIALSAPVSGTTLVVDTGLNPGWDTYNVFSIEPCPAGPGSGPAALLGLCASTQAALDFLILQVTTPSAPGNVFHFPATATSDAFGPFPLGPGIIVDAICFQVNPITGALVSGPVINYTTQ